MGNPLHQMPSYIEIQDVLDNVDSLATPAEVHGMLCGFICSGTQLDGQSWLERILATKELQKEKNKESREEILKLYKISAESLHSLDFDFALLLPDDDSPIIARAEALSFWCQGFINAVKFAGYADFKALSQDVQESLHYVKEIAKIDFEHIDATEDDEKAFIEVSEYVRMAVIFLLTELPKKSSIATKKKKKDLH